MATQLGHVVMRSHRPMAFTVVAVYCSPHRPHWWGRCGGLCDPQPLDGGGRRRRRRHANGRPSLNLHPPPIASARGRR